MTHGQLRLQPQIRAGELSPPGNTGAAGGTSTSRGERAGGVPGWLTTPGAGSGRAGEPAPGVGRIHGVGRGARCPRGKGLAPKNQRCTKGARRHPGMRGRSERERGRCKRGQAGRGETSRGPAAGGVLGPPAAPPKAGEEPRPHLPVRGGGGFPPGRRPARRRVRSSRRGPAQLCPLWPRSVQEQLPPSPPLRAAAASLWQRGRGWPGLAAAFPGLGHSRGEASAGAEGHGGTGWSPAVPVVLPSPPKGRDALSLTPPVSHLAATWRGSTRVGGEQQNK